MADPASPPRLIRFGVFEVDLRTGELRKHGRNIKLHGQPIDVLGMLLERPGEMVTREELQKKLWPEDTFVDFDHSLNTAINKLREVLGDSADNPKYVETVPRRGYRFIYPVAAMSPSPVGGGDAAATVGAGLVPVPQARERPQGAPLRKHWRLAVAAGLIVATLAALAALNVAGLRERLLVFVGARHGVPLQKIESIAVLPLENLSGDPEQEYFADGMTEELITTLGKIGALRVISRQSVMHFKGSKKTLPEIARELNVEAIVEGTVQRSGQHVRITANLLHAPTDRHLWAESYERDVRDVLGLQSEIARSIASEIRVRVSPQVQARLARSRPINPEAYGAYLRGQYFWNGTPQQLPNCVRSFQQAIDREPSFAPAYAGQALCYASLGFSQPPTEVFPKVRAAATKALEIDDTLAEAHVALARVKMLFDWDWRGAETELKWAIVLNPSSSDAHFPYSNYLTAMGRFEEAFAEAKRARDLDPLSLKTNAQLGWAYMHARRYDEAIVQYIKAVELDPNGGWAPGQMPWGFTLKGDYTQAFAEYEKIGTPANDPFLGYLYAVSGKRKEALQVAHELERLSKTQYVSQYDIAVPYAGLGDKDRALFWLNRAYEERATQMYTLNVDPWFDSLRPDPRFQDLLRRMNFPP
jgi:TolB-like protein/DNA-binding winged helix-turn-helix (wHTH) protein/tetratricopeptide (TPR) repeat protein